MCVHYYNALSRSELMVLKGKKIKKKKRRRVLGI